MSDGIGTIISNGIGDVYVRNTLRFNGAATGITPGMHSTVRLNHLHHQCWGLIQVNKPRLYRGGVWGEEKNRRAERSRSARSPNFSTWKPVNRPDYIDVNQRKVV